MSTVLLMTDSWQPTVLRLVPFSKNNARSLNSRSQRAHSNSPSQRGFPVLAVTRSGRKPSSSSGYRSVTPRSANSAHSDNTGEHDDASMISDTNVTCSTNRTDVSSGRSSSRYAKKRIPEVHSEMKEAIKFSVQDLNDQSSSISSIQSGDSKGESQDAKNKSGNSRAKLPRPSMMAPNDSMKGHAQTMGANKFVKLTPGEIELQKYRDMYATEQVQKKKKYKLNVNQLPRSTTPINDHDPDKLNMKQVIAFLQTKAGNVAQKNIMLEKKRDVECRTHQFSDRFIDIKNSLAPPKVASVESVSLQNSHSDGRHSDRTGNSRLENSGCVSVMSTKSSPNLPYRSGRQSVKSNASTTTSKASVKSERPNRRGDKSKQKEFRLYRFLAIAPDNPIANNFVNPEHSVPVIQRLSFKYSSQRDKSLGKAESSFEHIPGIKSRQKTTANMIHRRAAVNKAGPTTEAKDSEGSDKSIRLPLVTDADSPDDECETCSTTSATCNSAERSSKDGERTAFPKKGKVITLPEELVDMSHLPDFKQVHKDKTMGLTNGQGFLEQSTNQSESPRMAPISSPRQIHVTMPHAHPTRYSQEIVRLTLRQAKTATRVTSYMSDLASDGAFRGEIGDWKYQSPEDVDGYSANGFAQSNHPENREWVEHSRQFVNNIASNNFIKVRQKLRASNVNNVE